MKHPILFSLLQRGRSTLADTPIYSHCTAPANITGAPPGSCSWDATLKIKKQIKKKTKSELTTKLLCRSFKIGIFFHQYLQPQHILDFQFAGMLVHTCIHSRSEQKLISRWDLHCVGSLENF